MLWFSVHADACGEECMQASAGQKTLTSQLMTKQIHPGWDEFGFRITSKEQVGGLFVLAILLDPLGYFNFSIIKLAEE